MERPERLALMILGALVNRMPVALWILAIGPNITVIHRILHTWKQTKDVAPAPSASKAVGAREAELVSASVPAHVSREVPGTRPILTRTAGRGR